MEHMACGGCGCNIAIKINISMREYGFIGGTMLRCDHCGHVFFLDSFNPEAIEATGASKVVE